MSKLLNLPGSSTSRAGYHALEEPVRSHTVSAGGIPLAAPIELGDLANDAFYDGVATTRESVRAYDRDLSRLEGKHLYSLEPHPDPHTVERTAVELGEIHAGLAVAATAIQRELARLGRDVGTDEARRGHWDNLKAAFARAVERQRALEMAQRDRVKDRVARQYRIVKPDATEEEVNKVVAASSSSSSTNSSGSQIFQQALVGSHRTSQALSALSEAQRRQGELAEIERTLVELSDLVAQVAQVVVKQDSSVVKVERDAEQVERDVELGLEQVNKAKVSAVAARHKRKICLAIAIAMVIVVVVVVVVQFKGSGSGGGSSPGDGNEDKEPVGVTV